MSRMSSALSSDPPEELRKSRGAYFTPPAIADYLAAWAVAEDPRAKILDPTCGEAVFLLAAARQLSRLGAPATNLDQQVLGVDLHQPSLDGAMRLLEAEGLDARLVADDFFNLPTPSQLGCPLPEVDAIIGNPPFIRYQRHAGDARRRSHAAALMQGVRLSGLASSWAPLLVHACGFLKPEGRLAMVLPAELLTVHYAEPIRRWLRNRFAAVNLVLFERLQFADAQEKVMLVVAWGSGGCDSFSLYPVEDARELDELGPFDHFNAAPAEEGKWTDLLLSTKSRQAFRHVSKEQFTRLDTYGTPELGTVTGANHYFTMSEPTRLKYSLAEDQLARIVPSGSRYLRGLSFTRRNWEAARDAGEHVWLLHPNVEDGTVALQRYLEKGEDLDVPYAYKCQVRKPWWRPSFVPPPNLLFTYMSHHYPRLISNSARVGFLNSMHGIRFRKGTPKCAKTALPLLMLNSVTMLGAELYGRSYGGGVLKMEPREAASLPVPTPQVLEDAWKLIQDERAGLDRKLRNGHGAAVNERVDEILLHDVLKLPPGTTQVINEAARSLRERRLGREQPPRS